ncbi:tetratricopeptide repeat protein [Gloeobacter morelensis]|uniref:tetratricopeptide repeat protein n=1 Tax=Gloeobacter morelensis TaxID=2907343 RepID=UPI001E397FC3|nr:tetratricopeptide repeat protein [Gloeobacter morelensis]UFP97133.1 tetratricopeptide repeat protein [Gloeobacter morelensis MG652769]
MALQDTSPQAKEIGNNMADVADVAVDIVGDFVKKLFDTLRKGKALKEPDKAQRIEIKIGREIVYRGTEGQKPEIDKLTVRQAKLLEAAMGSPATPAAAGRAKAAEEVKGAATVKVNGEAFYQRSRGVVAVNKFAEDPAPHAPAAERPAEGVAVTAANRPATAVAAAPPPALQAAQAPASAAQSETAAAPPLAPSQAHLGDPAGGRVEAGPALGGPTPPRIAADRGRENGPQDTPAILAVAREQAFFGDHRGAIASYTKALKQTSDPVVIVDTLHKRADAYAASFGGSREADRDRASAHGLEASHALENGDKNRALALANEAVRLNRDEPSHHVVLAQVHTALGDHGTALEHNKKAVDLDQRRTEWLDGDPEKHDYLPPWDVYMYRADTREEIGDTQGAIGDYTKAIAHSQAHIFKLGWDTDDHMALNSAFATNIHSHNMRAECHSKLGNHREAVKDYTAAIRIYPSHNYAYTLRAQEHIALGRTDEAAQDLAKQSQVNEASGESSAAFDAHRGGDHFKAMQHLEKSLKLDPNNPDTYQLRAKVHAALGDHAASRKDNAKARSMTRSQSSVPVFTIIKNQLASSVKEGTFKRWITAAASSVSSAISAAGNALETGLQKLNDTVSSDKSVKVDFRTEREAQQVEKTARRLLDTYRGGGEERTFEMRKSGYTVAQQGDTLTVIDRQGREILNSSPGRLTANLSEADKRAFKASERQLDKGKSNEKVASL